MTQCCDFIGNIAVTTSAGISGVTGFGASRCSHNGFVAVADGRNDFNLGITADRAGVSDRTVLGAGGVHSHCFIAVTQSVYFIGNVAMTTGTSVSSIALFRTGRSSDGSFVIVTGSRQRLGIAVAANLTGEGLHTGRVTAGGSGDHCIVFVTQSVYHIVNVAITAGTGINGVSSLGASGSIDGCFVIVAGSRDDFDLNIATDHTGVGNTAVGSTGSVNSNRLVAVTQSCSLIGNIAVTANSAGIGGESSLSASGSSDNCFVAVTGSFSRGHATDCTGFRCGTGGICPAVILHRNGHGHLKRCIQHLSIHFCNRSGNHGAAGDDTGDGAIGDCGNAGGSAGPLQLIIGHFYTVQSQRIGQGLCLTGVEISGGLVQLQLQRAAGQDGVEQPLAGSIGGVVAGGDDHFIVLTAQLVQITGGGAVIDLESASGFIQDHSVKERAICSAQLCITVVADQVIGITLYASAAQVLTDHAVHFLFNIVPRG